MESNQKTDPVFNLNIYLLCLYISFKEFRDFSWMDMIIITLIFFVMIKIVMFMMLMMLMMLTIPWNNRQSPLRPRWCVEGETFFSADICRPHLNILLPHICWYLCPLHIWWYSHYLPLNCIDSAQVRKDTEKDRRLCRKTAKTLGVKEQALLGRDTAEIWW